MRILLLIHAFNSLSQRLYIELGRAGHQVSVEFDVNPVITADAVDRFAPDVIVAPYLKRAIGPEIWKRLPCLIVHPGIPGDRGPAALDWAILEGWQRWGATVLQAEAEMDAGPIWAWQDFPMRAATKSSLYRNEVSDAAVAAVNLALARLEAGDFQPSRADPAIHGELGQARPIVRQADRRIDWQRDDTASVLRKLRSADGVPGVKDELFGRPVHLFDGRPATGRSGRPGSVVAASGPAICRATTDGAVWIGHVLDPAGAHPFKLPARRVFADELGGLPDVPIDAPEGYREIRYTEADGIGYLHFDFYNGAMGAAQCERLLAAYRDACRRDTMAIVLMGGPDFWSNGMHLNLIEAADSPAEESWSNINAIDDLAEAIIRTEGHLTIAAIQGNAGAGGVFLARAADQVWLRDGVVLSPHYKDMGNLYGSEFWTYLLPRYAGEDNARRIVEARLPMGVGEAVELGLADACLEADRSAFAEAVADRAAALDDAALLAEKRARRAGDERVKQLAAYREEELERMRLNFFGFDPSYHVARYNFVYKVPKSRTPLTIASHRRQQSEPQLRGAR